MNKLTVRFVINGAPQEVTATVGIGLLALYDIEAYRHRWPSSKDAPGSAALHAAYVLARPLIGNMTFTEWLALELDVIRDDSE